MHQPEGPHRAGIPGRGRARGGYIPRQGRAENIRGRGERQRGAVNGARRNEMNPLRAADRHQHRCANEPRQKRPIGYKKLEDMEKNQTPQDIIIALGDSRSGLEELLRGDRGTIDAGRVQMLLKVFGKMLEADGPTELLSHVLRLIVTYQFDIRITEFVFGLLTETSPGRREKAPLHVTNSLKVAKGLLMVIPRQSEKKVAMMMCLLQAVIDGLGGMPSVQPLYNEVKEMLEEINQSLQKQREMRGARKTGSEALLELHQQQPPDNFRDIPVFPQIQDIQADAQPFIRSNLTDRAYQDMEHYLDVQYRLLREDFIRPLRDGIEEVRNYGDQQGKKHRFDSVKVYQDVKVLFAKPDQKGILHRIQFNTEKFQKIRWQNTKRLLYGNLLCFSSDQFKNDVIFAVVTDRKPEDLENGNLSVAFVFEDDDGDDDSDDDAEDDVLGAVAGIRQERRFRRAQRGSVDTTKLYTMVETDAYFEAYRHVLSGLRDTTHLPLERYIVGCSEDMHAPKYLRPQSGGRIRYDFSPVTGEKTMVDVLSYEWPTPDTLHLNQSQANALKLALTHELAVIQGPPGTGKTHVGLEVMKILIKNKACWLRNGGTSPILVVCYTNHALDQFLEGIARFASEDKVIVRVGGRCQNEVTKKFSLYEIRQKKRKNPDRSDTKKKLRTAIWNIREELKSLESRLLASVNRLEASLHCILHLEQLPISDRLKRQFQTSGIFNLGNSSDQFLSWLGLVAKKEEPDFEKQVFRLRGQTSMVLRMLGHTEEQIGRAFYEIERDDVSKLHEHIERNKDFWRLQGYENGEGAGNEVQMEEETDMKEEADMVQQQRMLDTDEFRGPTMQMNRAKEINSLMNEMAAMTFEDVQQTESLQEMEGGWQQTRQDKKKAKRMTRKQLSKTSVMTKEEEMNVTNIYDLPLEDRWRLYRTWASRYRDQFRVISDVDIIKYNELAQRLEGFRRMEDEEILQNADVVAVTTTGAAKYRSLIYKLRSKIVVVEEAAEVLEAHIITSMPKTTEHLILIGDHQQLKPSPTVYELAKRYNLDTSLFERLMKVNIPHVTLNIQHRMRPEIADLIRPRIYDDLQDHESVLGREEITGVQKSMYFVTHDVHEDTLHDGKTKQNLHEANFLVALCDYLLKQEYQPEQITILTTYTGQLFALRSNMKKVLRRGVRATAVDNFQGEENDIILLSLVRSNDEASIGFLAIENRICVALSRAKLALYCIGNMDILATKSKMWRKIEGHLALRDCVGETLMLQCKNHPEKLTPVKVASDFQKVPEGGCGQACQTRLECGHVCPRLCHPEDHSKYNCKKSCTKILSCGHQCKQPCSEDCTPCLQKVKKTLICGHSQDVNCSQSIDKISCNTKVKVNLRCGHMRDVKCGDSAQGHQIQCQERCSELLDCLHACKGKCATCYQGRLHLPCGKICGRTLVCGHECRSKCSHCPPCEKTCRTRCVHSKCDKKCGEPCTLCREPCSWKCKHQKCSKLCSEPCDRGPCNEPCQKVLKCEHPCIGLCGEPCPKLCRVCDSTKVTEIFFGDEDDKDARFVQLEDCGHIFTYASLDTWMSSKTGNAIEMKRCPRCNATIWRSMRYGNVVNQLIASVNKVKEKQWGDATLAEGSRLELIKEFEADARQRVMRSTSEFSRIVTMLKKKPSPGKIVILEKAFRRMQMLYNLRKARDKLTRERNIRTENFTIFDMDLSMVSTWVMQERLQITENEDTCFKNEAKRLKHVLKYIDMHHRSKILSVLTENVFDMISQLQKLLLERIMPYDNTVQNDVRRLFKAIYQLAPELRSELGITEEEKRMICSAMGFASKGHWFECPNGHVYAIGECGGATTTAECPECRAEIGGMGHRLLSSNRVSGLMDGATLSAYDRDMQHNRIPNEMLLNLNAEGFH